MTRPDREVDFEFDMKYKDLLDAEMNAHADNVWMCIECGHLGCGRGNFDGRGAFNHAIDHFYSLGHCMNVKLGTIRNDGTCTVHCYRCDMNIREYNINAVCKSLGIRIADIQTKKKKDDYPEVKLLY